MQSFHEYMVLQLKQYILTELQRGVQWEDIEKALYHAGHQKNVIDEAFDEVKKESAGLDAEMPKEEVAADLVGGVKGSIQNFFSKLQTRQVKETKREISKESTDEIIGEAVTEAKAEEQSYIFEGYVFFLYLLILAFVVFFTAGGTDDDLLLVVAGFSPTFISAIISFVLVRYAKYAPLFILIPIAASTVFYALARFSGMAIFANMDFESLSIINAIMGMLFNVILINIAFLRPSPKVRQDRSQVYHSSGTHKQVSHHQHPNHAHAHPKETHAEPVQDFQRHIGELKREFNIHDSQMP